MTPSRVLLLGITIVTLATGLAAPRGASGGSIKGTVVLKGATPELRKLAVTIDQYVCGKEKNPEDLLLSPQGGIRNAVVWLDKPPATATADVLPSTTAMDQKECMFAPRVVMVPLRPHRREISVVFLDLRGFTAFAEMSEPEEVSDVLGAYHAEMGRLILEHGGTLERFTGDGMMIFFNDPVPVANPEERAVRMASAMRARIRVLGAEWRQRVYDLDFSMGIAKGYATIGAIGFEGRQDYAAIGSVTNLASRLCAEASPDQILISQRIHAVVTDLVKVKEVGPLQLKGFHRPIVAYEVVDLKERAP